MKPFRFEEKYLLTDKQYTLIKQRVEKLLLCDLHATNGSYTVHSIYYDDHQKTGIAQKEDGVKDRYKYRIRYYKNQTEAMTIEKKIKDGEAGIKQKLKITSIEYEKISKNDCAFLLNKESSLAKEFYVENRSHLLRPVLEVVYEREPFVHPANDVRITFDKNVRYRLLTRSNTTTITDYIIMEIKYNGFFPSHLKTVFEVDSPRKLAISKYVLCYHHHKQEDFEL